MDVIFMNEHYHEGVTSRYSKSVCIHCKDGTHSVCLGSPCGIYVSSDTFIEIMLLNMKITWVQFTISLFSAYGVQGL